MLLGESIDRYLCFSCFVLFCFGFFSFTLLLVAFLFFLSLFLFLLYSFDDLKLSNYRGGSVQRVESYINNVQ